MPSRLRLLGALLVFLAVSGWPASAAAPPARRLVAREFVAVADLDPDIVVDLNVVSGHVRVSGDNLLDAPVAEIGDPRHGHRLFRYTGGIPGLTPVRGSADVGARTRGRARLPVWGLARRVRYGGGFLIVFPDGRRVRVRTDRTGRAVSIGWPGNGGGTLTASVRYTNALTTVSDPFGISRVYRHDRAGHASRVVPASWRGPGYRHPLVDVLDNPRETGWLQYRSADYTDRVARAARNDLAYERPADGGILEVALASLRRARRLDSLLGRLGLLDMTQVQSALLNQQESQGVDAQVGRRLDPILKDCHLSYGVGGDVLDVTVSSTITPAELATVHRTLARVPAWTLIRRGGPSLCAVALTADSTALGRRLLERALPARRLGERRR